MNLQTSLFGDSIQISLLSTQSIMTTVKESPQCRSESNVRGEGPRSLSTDPPNKEWDQCVRKGSITVGAGMVVGMFVGMLMGMGVPLAWGTGAGILWSVKRCRALIRDGIMTPEQARAKKEEKARERERKRMLEEEMRKKKASAPKNTQPKKTEPKGGKRLDPASDSHECCKKLKDLLEKEKPKEREPLKKVDKELSKCGKMNQPTRDQLGECRGDGDKGEIVTPKDGSQDPCKSKLNFISTTTVKLFVPPSPAFRTRVTANGTDIVCTCNEGKDGKMDTCPSCALVSSRKEFGEPTQLTLLDDPFKKYNDEDDDNLIFPRPQKCMDEDQNADSAESSTVSQFEEEEIRKNPSNMLVLQEVRSTIEDQDVLDEDEEISPVFFGEQPSPMDEDMEEEVIEISGDRVEVIIHEVDDDTEDIDDGGQDHNREPEVVLPDIPGFAQELSNQDEELNEEDDSKEEVIFVETYKSESWPFSFSLPSLNKFHKKTADSTFKWPPLPSSIIVRPRKEPACTCTKSNAHEGQEHVNENFHPEPLGFETCTCGQPEDECECDEPGQT